MAVVGIIVFCGVLVWPVCLVTEPARASEGSGRGPGAGRISYRMEKKA